MKADFSMHTNVERYLSHKFLIVSKDLKHFVWNMIFRTKYHVKVSINSSAIVRAQRVN